MNLLGSLTVLALFVAAAVIFSPAKQKTGGPNGVTGIDKEKERLIRERQEVLAQILRGMDPLQLQFTTDPPFLANELNTWYAESGKPNSQESHPAEIAAINKLLQGQARLRALRDDFSVEDILFIRESILARDIVRSVTRELTTDPQRIVALFQFTIRNTTLVEDDPRQPLPLSPHEILVFNLGTRDDRIWTFATLLRQLQLDALVLTAPEEAGTVNPLVAVPTPHDGILLFDPRLGLPIPGAADDGQTPWIESAARLDAVLKDESPLRKFDFPGLPYPLTAAALKNSRVELVGVASRWAPRMAQLQSLLPPDMNLVLYDDLSSAGSGGTGQYERAIACGAGGLWTPDQVSVWRYPERALEFIAAAKGNEDARFRDLLQVFRGPQRHKVVRRKLDQSPEPNQQPEPDQQPEIVSAEITLHAARIEQLTGILEQAIPHYVGIRRAPFELDLKVNKLAASYAFVWSGMCQLERGLVDEAISTFKQFNLDKSNDVVLRRWACDAHVRALTWQGKLAEAAEVMEHAPPSNSRRRDAYLIRRWTQRDVSRQMAPGGQVPPDAQPAAPAAGNDPPMVSPPEPLP